ncbi:hypothetical protein [Phaeobacter italicus]|jgi:hypothetical protein|uniref:hypothetical protein n=1 Tax=Phaeobacter italicus TaxID=481446 RepID=UPI0013F4CFAB|nr:hypothetical protein [Phaeobacter italicus]
MCFIMESRLPQFDFLSTGKIFERRDFCCDAASQAAQIIDTYSKKRLAQIMGGRLPPAVSAPNAVFRHQRNVSIADLKSQKTAPPPALRRQ